MPSTATAGGRVLAWMHIGDLHLTDAGLENHRDLGRIVALANALPPGSLDFAVLPGDNADDGTAGQFQLVRDAVAPLRLPLHILPGDLREGGERLGALLARPQVLCVDMGHTHYNELANDGGTIFMATRSTGQVEEGPPGFSIAALDGRTVSWRFKALDHAWPFVLVTQPADRRLATDAGQAVRGPFTVRAKVLGDAPAASVEAQVDGGGWTAMAPVPGEAALWDVRCKRPGTRVRVRARDAQGRQDEDAVEPALPGWTAPRRAADGSDRDRVGAWPERGILDTQLGPNRMGKKW